MLSCPPRPPTLLFQTSFSLLSDYGMELFLPGCRIMHLFHLNSWDFSWQISPACWNHFQMADSPSNTFPQCGNAFAEDTFHTVVVVVYGVTSTDVNWGEERRRGEKRGRKQERWGVYEWCSLTILKYHLIFVVLRSDQHLCLEIECSSLALQRHL